MNRWIITAFAVVSIGCAGAQTEVIAPQAKMPVSLSRGVRDADGNLVPEERKVVVGHFEDSQTAWGMAYSLVKLTPTTDISNALNEQVSRVNGDAVIRTTIRSKTCAMNFFSMLNWLPFWPGCTRVVVAGDIIQVRK